jgi:hypothetical protein
MDMTKESRLNSLDRQRMAEEIAVEAKVLIRCGWHECPFQDDADYTPAYTLGKRKYSRGGLFGVFRSTKAMMDEIKHVVDHAPMECPRCAHERAKPV